MSLYTGYNYYQYPYYYGDCGYRYYPFFGFNYGSEVMAAIEEGTETAGIMDMAVIAAAIMAASIDKNANIFI